MIDNNTTDSALWLPVQAHCEQLCEQFRFFTLGKWQGFKAGALNFALQVTADDAEIIGVVDSDYLVEPDWLRTFTPKQRIGAAIAGMSLTHTIGLGVIRGLFTSNQPFLRTPKAEDKPALIQGLLMVRQELIMLVGLMTAIAAIVYHYKMSEPDVVWWVVILAILSLPYISALYMSLANVKPWRTKAVKVLSQEKCL